MLYGFLADLTVIIHAAYVGVVVFGLLAILLGRVLGWEWVRNRWFRLTHVLMIGIVAFEALAEIDCPLTVWENQLRSLSGQSVSEGTFMGRILHDLIFFDLPPWTFTTIYLLFALLVVSTFWITPVRWRPRRLPSAPGAHPSARENPGRS